MKTIHASGNTNEQPSGQIIEVHSHKLTLPRISAASVETNYQIQRFVQNFK